MQKYVKEHHLLRWKMMHIFWKINTLFCHTLFTPCSPKLWLTDLSCSAEKKDKKGNILSAVTSSCSEDHMDNIWPCLLLQYELRSHVRRTSSSYILTKNDFIARGQTTVGFSWLDIILDLRTALLKYECFLRKARCISEITAHCSSLNISFSK